MDRGDCLQCFLARDIDNRWNRITSAARSVCVVTAWGNQCCTIAKTADRFVEERPLARIPEWESDNGNLPSLLELERREQADREKRLMTASLMNRSVLRQGIDH